MHRSEEVSRAPALVVKAFEDSMAKVPQSRETHGLLLSSKNQSAFKQPGKRVKPVKK